MGNNFFSLMGIKWYGKDTTLSGVFGAMGA